MTRSKRSSGVKIPENSDNRRTEIEMKISDKGKKTDQVWSIVHCEGSDYLKTILEFMLSHFAKIFGAKTMLAEQCLVFNDSEAICPMLVTNGEQLMIRLNQQSLSFWAQTIYQLSHEMTPTHHPYHRMV